MTKRDPARSDGDSQLTPEDMESIGRGLAQADAGELIDGDEVIAELFASVGLENPPVFNAGNPRAALRKTAPLVNIHPEQIPGFVASVTVTKADGTTMNGEEFVRQANKTRQEPISLAALPCTLCVEEAGRRLALATEILQQAKMRQEARLRFETEDPT